MSLQLPGTERDGVEWTETPKRVRAYKEAYDEAEGANKQGSDKRRQ